MTLTFFIPGRPVSQGSASAFPWQDAAHGLHARVTDKTKGLKPWREVVGWEAKAAMRRTRHPGWLHNEPVSLTMEFVFPRLKGHPKTWTPPHVSRPDGSKLQRAVEDAFTVVRLWHDDAQVSEWHGKKRYAEILERAGVWITVKGMAPTAK